MPARFPDAAAAVLDRSDALARRAEALIARLRVRELWSRAGLVVPVGALRFGLMASPNIDYEIYAERPDPATGDAVMAELAAAPGVTGMERHDFMANPADPGLYWRLDCRDVDGEAWDFDFWLVPFSHPHAGMAEAFARAMNAALTPWTRAIILPLKAALADRARTQGQARPRGVDIYRAVLDGCVRDMAGFDAWRAVNPPPELETWRPGR